LSRVLIFADLVDGAHGHVSTSILTVEAFTMVLVGPSRPSAEGGLNAHQNHHDGSAAPLTFTDNSASPEQFQELGYHVIRVCVASLGVVDLEDTHTVPSEPASSFVFLGSGLMRMEFVTLYL